MYSCNLCGGNGNVICVVHRCGLSRDSNEISVVHSTEISVIYCDKHSDGLLDKYGDRRDLNVDERRDKYGRPIVKVFKLHIIRTAIRFGITQRSRHKYLRLSTQLWRDVVRHHRQARSCAHGREGVRICGTVVEQHLEGSRA